MRRTSIVIGVVLLMAGIGQADILLDLGNYAYAPLNYSSDPLLSNPQEDGLHWQGSTYQTGDPNVWLVTVADAIDQTGANTGVGIEVQYCNLRSFDMVNRNGGDFNPVHDIPALVPVRADNDWFLWNDVNHSTSGSATGRIKFTGLSAGSYDLSAYVYNPTNDAYSICAGTVSVGAQSHYYLGWQDGPQVLSFTSVVPVAGEIIIEFTPDPSACSSSQTTYNGAFLGCDAITLVPEPATLALLALGSLAAIRRRR